MLIFCFVLSKLRKPHSYKSNLSVLVLLFEELNTDTPNKSKLRIKVQAKKESKSINKFVNFEDSNT